MSRMWDVPTVAPLAPHPWDKWGKPPRLGMPYTVAEQFDALVEPALKAARALTDADYEREEAERHEDAADEFERDARPYLEMLPEKLADAIRDQPDLFRTADDVLKAAQDAA